MTLHLNLKPETEQILRERAEQHHLPVEDYLRTLVESALHPGIIPARDPDPTPEELDQWFKDMAQFSDKIPNHPGSFWTRDIISDDDRG